jgi:fumarate reductase flavoprotein subunit
MPDGTPEVPVCIVGGGSCGLSAAIALRQAGIEALVLERDANPTGSTALSSGFIPAAQTRLQRALGIEDSYQRLIDDVMNKAHGQACRSKSSTDFSTPVTACGACTPCPRKPARPS